MQPRRPLAAFALFFMAGIALAWLVYLQAYLFLMPVGVAGLLFVKGKYAANIKIALFSLGLGSLALFVQVSCLQAQPLQGNLKATVCEMPVKTQTGYYLMLNELELDGGKVPGRARYFSAAPFECGMVIRLRASLNPPVGRRNPGGNDARVTLFSKYARWSVSGEAKAIGSKKTILSHILRLRKTLTNAVDSAYAQDEAATLKAMLFGEKGDTNDEWMASFYVVGVGHIFSVSGLHVGIIAAALLLLFKRLPGWVSGCTTVALLIVYAALAAFSASVIRAVIMTAIALALRGSGEKVDLQTSLGAAALIMLAVNPIQLFTASFALSFAAVLGIAMFEKPFSDFLKSKLPQNAVMKFLCSSVSVSLAATLGILPVQILFFGTVNTLSVVANLPAVPLASLAIVLGLASTLLGAAWLPLAMPLAFAVSLLIKATVVISQVFASIPFAQVTVGSNAWLAAALFAALAALKVSGKTRLAATVASCALVCAFVTVRVADYNTPRLTVLDVGQGVAAHISYKGVNILIDGGNNAGFDNGTAVLLPYFRSQGINRLYAVIATHPHADHVGGLSAVVREMTVDAVYTNGRSEPIVQFEQLVQAAGEKNLSIQTLSRGSEISVEDLRLNVLHPKKELEGNEASLIIRAECGGGSFMITGDAGKAAEEIVIANGDELDCDILLCGHHGSASASSQEFLSASRPEYAIISVGRNTYGHPSPQVLERLTMAGAKIRRTDRLGAVMFRLGKTIRVKTMLGANNDV